MLMLMCFFWSLNRVTHRFPDYQSGSLLFGDPGMDLNLDLPYFRGSQRFCSLGPGHEGVRSLISLFGSLELQRLRLPASLSLMTILDGPNTQRPRTWVQGGKGCSL